MEKVLSFKPYFKLMNVWKFKIPINGNVCLEALGFPFALPHISVSQGECVWVLLLLSFIPDLFCFCLVISLINLRDEHKVKVATLSMICFFSLPFFAWFYSYLFWFLFIVRSWGSLITLILLLCFVCFMKKIHPKSCIMSRIIFLCISEK